MENKSYSGKISDILLNRAMVDADALKDAESEAAEKV